MTSHTTIAIDGPVASGKSTVGRVVARRLGYRFLDTGWMYRAVAYAGLSAGLDLHDHDEVSQLAGSLTMRLVEAERGERLLVDGEDITDLLHESHVEQGVVPVAANRSVRRVLVQQQRLIATDGPIVMVGRDIGTMVSPDATIKFYLTASQETRARRRYEERKNTPDSPAYKEVLERLVHRDRIDSQRAESHPADDAVIIDTDSLDVCETARRIIDLVEGA
ncbi:MAG: (d)CMP kinase [Chloroflexi bacterium]|nr:(d)CMP kinase [Chloroflexota bacterium]